MKILKLTHYLGTGHNIRYRNLYTVTHPDTTPLQLGLSQQAPQLPGHRVGTLHPQDLQTSGLS